MPIWQILQKIGVPALLATSIILGIVAICLEDTRLTFPAIILLSIFFILYYVIERKTIVIEPSSDNLAEGEWMKYALDRKDISFALEEMEKNNSGKVKQKRYFKRKK